MAITIAASLFACDGVGPDNRVTHRSNVSIVGRLKQISPVSRSALSGLLTGADALPVYRFLGARLAAESCVLLASKGL